MRLAVGVLALLMLAARQDSRDLGREVLAPGDGWGALGEGVTGGSGATPDRVSRVRNRRELVAALTFPSDVPKIVYIDGTIDANEDEAGNPLSCESYGRQGYTLETFLAAYDPDGPWGPRPPAETPGSLEAARRASATAQRDRVRIRVPDNTTIVGVDANARLRGAQLDVSGTTTSRRRNVIIRNLTFQDVHDCFPAWTPGTTADGRWNGTGEWNSEYDAITVREAERVWIDHNEFRDLNAPSGRLPRYFGARYEIHDGHLDITNASDRVTVSWNRFKDHDKVMLIGSSDTAPGDVGRLRVTLHHNMFEDLGQRTPRVRYGQVHVYNNYYRVSDASSYGYSWGVGVQSSIYAENNFFWTEPRVTPDRFISRINGSAITAIGTLHNPDADTRAVDPVAVYNAVRNPDLATDVGWRPTLALTMDPTHLVPAIVTRGAGPFDW